MIPGGERVCLWRVVAGAWQRFADLIRIKARFGVWRLAAADVRALSSILKLSQTTMVSIDTPTPTRNTQVLWLRPNRALSLRALRWVAGLLATYVMLVALLSALAGNPFAPLFALFDAGIVLMAFLLVWRAGQRAERITLSEASLEVARFPPEGPAVQLQPYWVRVRLQPGPSHARLTLVSHGRATEIGAFLGEDERVALCNQLQAGLARLRQPAHITQPGYNP